VLLEYGTANYEHAVVDSLGQAVAVTTVSKGVQTKINGVLETDAAVTYKKGEKDKIVKTSEMQENILAPIVKGQKIGVMVYKVGDTEIGRFNLLAENDMKKASWITLFFRMVASWFRFGKK
jgi:D-alanyl-D-alanine carboxypeptidase (penicillin-binding protein 5/6)